MKAKGSAVTANLFVWLVALCVLALSRSEDAFDSSASDKLGQQKDVARGLFAPRMDYDQWKPLGQGDPLKNDPTYDYAPPVLDRVHYWIDPASRKPDPPNPTENQKKTEILLLGVSSKKPATTTTTVDNRKDMFDSFLKFVDGPNLGYHRVRPQYTYYSTNFYKNQEQKEPYTILVPPPISEQNYQQPLMSSTSTTTPIPFTASSTSSNQIAIEEANLIYHSSSIATSGSSGDIGKWKGSNTHATIAESSNQVTWKTPTSDSNINNTKQLPSIKNPENFSKIPPRNTIRNPSIKMQDSVEKTMHKGQVTDDTLDLTNTFVNIGKPDAQILNSPLITSVINPMITPIGSHSIFRKPQPSQAFKKTEVIPLTLQTMHTMQTLLPPPVTQHLTQKKPLLHTLLKNEISTTVAPQTTSNSLTTDILFKHYKQPVEPVKGPLYLIIQGHSKVKTYGPSKQINGISVQETNEIPTFDDQQTEYPVKHLHEIRKDNREEWDREKRDNRSGRLQTLKHVVVTGLGAIDLENFKETEVAVKYDVSNNENLTTEVYHKGIVESDIL